MNKKYILRVEELNILADDLLNNFKSGIVILRGNLASGKTTFVKTVVKKLKINDDVTSPTFSIQQHYGDNIFHYDIYNHGIEHFISLGMLEELEKDGLHFVEWGDDKLIDILTSAGMDVMSIDIEKTSDESREYKICIH